MIVPTIDLGGNPLATFWEDGVNAIWTKVIGGLRKLIGSPETGVIGPLWEAHKALTANWKGQSRFMIHIFQPLNNPLDVMLTTTAVY